MPDKCCVPGCSLANPKQVASLKFYPFPRDENLAHQWKSKLCIRNSTSLSRVCSMHFNETDFMLTNLGWKVLTPSAVPSLTLDKTGDSEKNIVTHELDMSAPHRRKRPSPSPTELSCLSRSVFKCKSTCKTIDALKLRLIFNELRAQSKREEMTLIIKGGRETERSERALAQQVDDLTYFGELHEALFEGVPPQRFNNDELNVAESTNGEGCDHVDEFESDDLHKLSECGACDLKLPKRFYLEHLLAHRMWSCHLCPKACRQKSGLLHHYETFHSGEEPNFICAYCGKRFKSYQSISSHLLVHEEEKMSYCRICGECIENSKALLEHFCGHFKIEKCVTCNREFWSVEVLEAHRRLHCYNENALNFEVFQSNCEFWCYLCDKTCKNLEAWQKHFQSHVNNNEWLYLSDTGFTLDKKFPEISDSCKNTISSSVKGKLKVKKKSSNTCKEPQAKGSGQSVPYVCKKLFNGSNNKIEKTSLSLETYDRSKCEKSGINCENSQEHEVSNSKPIIKLEESVDTQKPLNSEGGVSEYTDEFCCIECGEQCGSSLGLAHHYEKHVKEEPNDSWSSDDETV